MEPPASRSAPRSRIAFAASGYLTQSEFYKRGLIITLALLDGSTLITTTRRLQIMNSPLTLKTLLVLGLAAFLCFTAGCRDKNTATPSDAVSPPTPEASQSEGRLTAAVAISDSFKRDAALRAVADQAAQAGDAATVKKAVLEIGDSNKKDDAASSSALALANVGKRTDAAKVARMISDTDKRDNTLSKLAGK